MEILSPRVYFEEKSSGLNPIAGAGTSTVLFVGLVKEASASLKVTKITNYSEFVSEYGGGDEAKLYGTVHNTECYLPYAVKHFFAEGGTVCYVLNLNDGAKKTFAQAKDLILANEQITILCYPEGAADATFAANVVEVCTKINAFAIIDAVAAADHTDDEIDLATFSAVGSLYDKMLAVYYPWVKVVDATDATQTVDIPPSCVVAGVYARTDGERGVHKAPAGISGGICRSVVGVTNPASEIEHDKFVERSTNKEGIKVNFIRPVVGVGTCIWGARTWYPSGAASGERYVNVCRLEAFLKDSLRDGLMWVTFKPNTPELWGQVNRSVTAFMRRLWQEGALFGSKEEEAFQVIVDKTNNAETMALGELHITLKYAPVKPAEFVVLTFTQKTSQG